MSKEIFKIVKQGEVKINEAFIVAESPNIVCVQIDMGTKYAEFSATMFGDHTNSLGIMDIVASGDSTNLYEGKDFPTEISFPSYDGFRCFSKEISRYSMHLCFIKETEEF